jgi:hypothetical protein
VDGTAEDHIQWHALILMGSATIKIVRYSGNSSGHGIWLQLPRIMFDGRL